MLALAGASGGCAEKVDPSFRITVGEAHAALKQMHENPKSLPRPVVVIGGFLDPGILPPAYEDFVHGISPHAPVVLVTPGFAGNFDDCRRMVIDAVEAAYPSSDPRWTSEVDVIGLSLGGLVARYAAAPSSDPSHPRRLRIARLFTVSSPHAGATLAQAVALNDLERDMVPGSMFLRHLASEDAAANYELIPYVLLNDEIVGERYAAPPGRNSYWLDDDSIVPPHAAAMLDERIMADIARRLRDESPFSKTPPAPLPLVGQTIMVSRDVSQKCKAPGSPGTFVLAGKTD